MNVTPIGGGAVTSPQTQLANGTAETPSTSEVTNVMEHFTSPIVTFDGATGAVIFEYRDVITGDRLYQHPSRVTLQYEQAQRLAEATRRD